MNAADLIALAERIEAYDPKGCPDNRAFERPIEVEIAIALGLIPANSKDIGVGVYSWDETGNSKHDVPAYLRSLDAAMSLVAEDAPELKLSLQVDGTWRAIVWRPERNVGYDAEAKTAALALTASALRARAASVDTRPKDEDPAETGASLASGAVPAQQGDAHPSADPIPPNPNEDES